MSPLGLAPLPISRLEGEAPESAGWDDFVSTDALRQVLSGACSGRLPVSALDMGLSSNDDDFAAVAMVAIEPAPRVFVPVAWQDSVAEDAAFSRRIFTPVFDPVETRATPPELPAWEAAEAGLVSRSGYRWWVPGIVGVAATFVLSAVLFLSSQQSGLPHPALETIAPQPVGVLPTVPDTVMEAPATKAKDPTMAAASLGAP